MWILCVTFLKNKFHLMMDRTGRYTVPQIYIGDFHVGGYDDLSQLEREGKLESLLRAGTDEHGAE